MRAKQQGVAVPRLRQYVPGRNHPSRSRLVFHDDALPEPLSQFLRHEPRRNVRRPAGADADDKPYGPGGIDLLRLDGSHDHYRRKGYK